MSRVRTRTSTGPRSLDWVVDRAFSSSVPTPARDTFLSKTHADVLPWARAMSRLLVSHAWEKISVLEIAGTAPFLHDWCSERGIGRYSAYLMQGGDCRVWAGSHPSYQFYSGGSSNLGMRRAGKFDWIVETGRAGLVFSRSKSEEHLKQLREHAGLHGQILSRVHLDSNGCWVKWSTAYVRAKLHITQRWKMEDGTSIILSQR